MTQDASYCFGIDVGGTTIKCGLFGTDGTLQEKWELKTRLEEDGCHILPDVAESVLDKMRTRELEPSRAAGLGIGIPGPVDENGETDVAVNLHWGHVNVSEDLEKLTGLKVKAGNDANVAALGELWKGGGSGCKSMIYVTLGTGVGGAVILHERIVTGAHGAAGEIGHAHVDDTIKEPCNCGGYGCLEQVASATGISRLAYEELEKNPAPSLLRNLSYNISAKTVFDAVKEGDALAIQVAKRFGVYLGKALSVFASVVDPEVIVIGGGVSKAGPILLDFIQEPFRQYVFAPCRDIKFALAQLENDAGIYGAAKLVLQ